MAKIRAREARTKTVAWDAALVGSAVESLVAHRSARGREAHVEPPAFPRCGLLSKET